jgi:hypothetical protein
VGNTSDIFRYFVMLELAFSTGFVFARMLSHGLVWRQDPPRFLMAITLLLWAAAGVSYMYEHLGQHLHPGTPLLCAGATILIVAQIMIGRQRD